MENYNSNYFYADLILKYLRNGLDTAEKGKMDKWLASDPKHQEIFSRLTDEQHIATELEIYTSFDKEEVRARLLKQVNSKTVKSLWPRIAGIAAAVIGIAICVWFYTSRHEILRGALDDKMVVNDIAPGGNRATLTAANGNTINLSEAKTGIVVNDDITYNDGTGIAALSSRANAKDLLMQTLTTPKGGTYSIILQDGTKVWLNADSKLEFLSNYRNKLQRIVKLIAGEAYFEVAKDAKRPFIVQTKAQTIEVLGTHFNVNTYGDEHPGTVTSLLEGSVKASNENGTRILKPGERGVSTIKGILLLIGNASDDAAWKNDKFQFNNTPLFIVMSQLARWYDVEVVYPNGIPDEKFSGDIDRSLNASEVLGMLTKMHVKFKIEGKKIIVNK